jgi:hypothetical protein
MPNNHDKHDNSLTDADYAEILKQLEKIKKSHEEICKRQEKCAERAEANFTNKVGSPQDVDLAYMELEKARIKLIEIEIKIVKVTAQRKKRLAGSSSVMMKPSWLDNVIEKVIDSGDPGKIAQAIATNPEFLGAIKSGLANKPMPPGPGYAQNIRTSIIEMWNK